MPEKRGLPLACLGFYVTGYIYSIFCLDAVFAEHVCEMLAC